MLDGYFLASNVSRPIYDPIRDGAGYRSGTRIARVQVLIALFLGLSAFLIFCVLRKRYPRIYVANFNNINRNYLHSHSRRNLPPLSQKSLFGWVPVVFKISESQVLEHAGLDAVVFLGFFKMCITALAICVIFAVAIISPIRYKYTGRVDLPDPDDDDDDNGYNNSTVPKVATRKLGFLLLEKLFKNKDPDHEPIVWMYTAFTYIFTGLLIYLLHKQTLKIIEMRQSYLGKQKSITDRTIKVSGISPSLREEEALKRHINSLGVGEVESVVVVKEWNALNSLFKMRQKVLNNLEEAWVKYFGDNGLKNTTDVMASRIRPSIGDSFNLHQSSGSAFADEIPDSSSTNGGVESSAASVTSSPSIIDQITEHIEDHNALEGSASQLPLMNDVAAERPKMRKGWLGIFGPEVDCITYYTNQLEIIDKEIKRHRLREFPPSSTAFITMRSVAQAQMLAQAVLDPKVNHLITSLAPAPHDIIWENLCLTRKERNSRIFFVMVFIGLISVLLVYPVKFLSNFLNVKTISKISPRLGAFLKDHTWAEYLITGILPPYVFTIFNIVMPYFYIWVTKRQGYTSHGDEELSIVSKNFFYIFVNLFLVFTLFGTAIISDTAQLAYQLAYSLQKLSLFYVDLIILQGIGIFPYKLLLLGNLLKYPIGNIFWCKTPRDYLNLYKPPVFNFGLQLPQPILVLIITITYSVISTKIVTAGLIYFIIGYFVFKYQLLYACVHPPHNTGKVWPLVVRRVIMGLLIFHMTMFGTLASQQAFVCATFLIPLPVFTVAVLWNFHKHYIPLSSFIALRAIENNQLPFHGDEEEGLGEEEDSEREQTLDERRELSQTYDYPHLVNDLDGPIIALENDQVLMIGDDGQTVKKPIPDI
ncbi:hypothetical protein ACI3LY_003060 [Candidozyma auris]|uniref:Integral membrane protein n=2 Tax=Candidozyma auris TaxID=498019 RepID=A0A2H0ZND2_CANAR|nr:hypothetical protein QG37_00964 [[Candida] auris]PIS52147.1 hypothetical protein B9J08_003758 [[Candida] auris]QWW21554.1 hypothetical protein CA7LBN_000300 [[Candida] auris]